MNTLFKSGLCVFALAAATPIHGSELGRLFFTPEQRAQLESGNTPSTGSGDSRRTISVSGIVQRHGGDRTVWINGVPKLVGKSDERSPESAPVTIPGQKKQVRVKVGQKVNIDSATPE